jgi:hypothetical protein
MMVNWHDGHADCLGNWSAHFCINVQGPYMRYVFLYSSLMVVPDRHLMDLQRLNMSHGAAWVDLYHNLLEVCCYHPLPAVTY